MRHHSTWNLPATRPARTRNTGIQAERVNEDKDFHLNNTCGKIVEKSLEKTMGKYGDAAVKAVRTYTNGRAGSIMDAWDIAVAEIFPHSPSSQVKGCPRGTFLGICESGIVSGVSAGAYTKSAKNKVYGLKAVDLLRKYPHYVNDQVALWKQIIGPETKVPNHQMDVVTSLWKSGLLRDTA